MQQWKAKRNAVASAPVPAEVLQSPTSVDAIVDADVSVVAVSPNNPSLTIGQVAKKAGVNVETVRFYEREGLIRQPPRPLSGYRLYPVETVRRIQFLRHCQELGFALKEAKALAELTDSSCACGQVTEKIHQLDAKITALHRLRDELHEMLGERPSGMCGVMEALHSSHS